VFIVSALLLDDTLLKCVVTEHEHEHEFIQPQQQQCRWLCAAQ